MLAMGGARSEVTEMRSNLFIYGYNICLVSSLSSANPG